MTQRNNLALSPDSTGSLFGSLRWWLWRVVRVVLVAYLVVVLLSMWFEEAMMFPASRYPAGDWNPPGLEFEDVSFSAADGTALSGWYFEHPAPRAHVLFCHGNAGNITDRAERVRYLRNQFRVCVFLFDYRGYGKSQGRPNEKGVLADARAARAWLAERAGIDPSVIVLMGRSLGGAVAVDLAAELRPRGLILESTFSSMTDVGAAHFPLLPVRLLMRNRFESAEKIAHYDGPLLQSHSRTDEVIPYRLGRKLFDAAPCGDQKQMIVMENRSHNDCQTREYYEALDLFLESLSRAQPGS